MSIKKKIHWIACLLFKAPVDFSAGLLGKCSFLAKKSTLHRPLIDPPDAQQQLPNPLNEGRRRLLFCCVSFAVNWFFDVPNKVKRDEYNFQDEPHQHIVIHPSQSMGNIMDRYYSFLRGASFIDLNKLGDQWADIYCYGSRRRWWRPIPSTSINKTFLMLSNLATVLYLFCYTPNSWHSWWFPTLKVDFRISFAYTSSVLCILKWIRSAHRPSW